mmetsp:Transcript_27401/g.65139  ORF Transcript_27401/g.65139 Transcript_27401/m.65139 type:complete len:104 (+) Transcript_27401:865-1176(+)
MVTSEKESRESRAKSSSIFSGCNLLHLFFDHLNCTVSLALYRRHWIQTCLSPSVDENERHSLYLKLLAQFGVGAVFKLSESCLTFALNLTQRVQTIPFLKGQL